MSVGNLVNAMRAAAGLRPYTYNVGLGFRVNSSGGANSGDPIRSVAGDAAVWDDAGRLTIPAEPTTETGVHDATAETTNIYGDAT